MNKITVKLLALLLLVCIAVSSLAACDNLPFLNGDSGSGEGGGNNGGGEGSGEHIDYVANTKLDMSSSTKKLEVQLKMHIDGDTSHFYVPNDVSEDGIMKARYLALNTPESTGSIEEWGKAASNFTKERVEKATSIIVESDTSEWNFDGNGRFLVWVWYKLSDSDEYRNLNLELLQNGLGVGGSNLVECAYGESAIAAVAQAKREKLYIFSDENDPDYPYGAALSVDLKELRTKIAEYDGKKVAFEGIVAHNSDWTAYVEAYDPESDMYYGIQVFYGYTSALHSVLAQGNKVRIVGSVSQFSGTYQVSGLVFQPMRPNAPDNTAKLNTGNEISYKETTAAEFTGEKTVLIDDVETTFDYETLAVSTSISMKNLEVYDVYTTKKGTSKGAMTLSCRVDGINVDVRTVVLKDAQGNVVTEDYFMGKTIDVKGVVDYFDLENTGNGTYQIMLYSLDDAVVHD